MPLFLLWGSFLNMLAYRLISQDSLLRPRSFCPNCNKSIAWYDLIPLVSWLILKAKCRWCAQQISWLYFFIETITTFLLSALIITIPSSYYIAYFIFFSALIITIRTDLEHMLISRFTTLFLVPVGFLLAYLQLLPISLKQSIIGSISAFLFLYLIGRIFYWYTHTIGMGQGDIELLMIIGTFLGITGWWITLILASALGSLYGIFSILLFKNKIGKIPFGPFLALGAVLYSLYPSQLTALFFF